MSTRELLSILGFFVRSHAVTPLLLLYWYEKYQLDEKGEWASADPAFWLVWITLMTILEAGVRITVKSEEME